MFFYAVAHYLNSKLTPRFGGFQEALSLRNVVLCDFTPMRTASLPAIHSEHSATISRASAR